MLFGRHACVKILSFICFLLIMTAQNKLFDQEALCADTPVVHEVTGPSEKNLFSGTRLIDSRQPSTKQVRPLCQLHKVLKFKLSPDSEIRISTAEKEAK